MSNLEKKVDEMKIMKRKLQKWQWMNQKLGTIRFGKDLKMIKSKGRKIKSKKTDYSNIGPIQPKGH
jgi:hypothetical protein